VLCDRATKRSDPRGEREQCHYLDYFDVVPGFRSFEETAIDADRTGLARCEVATATADRLRFFACVAAN